MPFADRTIFPAVRGVPHATLPHLHALAVLLSASRREPCRLGEALATAIRNERDRAAAALPARVRDEAQARAVAEYRRVFLRLLDREERQKRREFRKPRNT